MLREGEEEEASIDIQKNTISKYKNQLSQISLG